MNFKVGDRVRYVGSTSMWAVNKGLGTIESVDEDDTAWVKWDIAPAAGDQSRCAALENLAPHVEAPARDERRERIATAVLAAWAAGDPGPRSAELARAAVEWADALIAELDR